MTDVTTCRDCGAPVVFARNVDTGSRMILNAAVDLERGNVLVDPRGAEARCRIVDGDTARAQRAEGIATYLSHHATCPDAAKLAAPGNEGKESPMIVDLADPRIRSIAVAAVSRSLSMGASFCPDKSRAVAGQAVDDAFAAIGNYAITAGEVPTDHVAA